MRKHSLIVVATLVSILGLSAACTSSPSEQSAVASPAVYDVQIQGVTLASLPTCNAAIAGETAYVSTPAGLYSCIANHWIAIPCTTLLSGAVAYASATQSLWACSRGAWTPVTLNGGPAGPTGATGATGATGPAGAESLVNVTTEPAGVHCATGGERIDVGVDTNGDGVLESSEIQHTSYVCNGATGGTGPCTQGALQCADQQPQQCAADGTWASIGPTCAASGQACVAGTCVGVCAPKSTRCSNTPTVETLQTCANNGTWSFSTPCAHQCESLSATAGECVTALAVSAGSGATCAVMSNGTVECWGAAGATPTSAPYSGVPVLAPVSGATSVSVGKGTACAVLSGGTVSCWGPLPVGDPSALRGVKSVSASDLTDCALLDDGTVSCWGDNSFGQLGNGSTVGSSATPVKVTRITTAIALSASGLNACVVLAAGTVACWGANTIGELGLGTLTNAVTAPVVLGSISSAVDVAVGDAGGCALLAGGQVSCWGYIVGSNAASTTPVLMPGIVNATAIAVGDHNAYARLADGTLYQWGDESGQLPSSGSTPVATGLSVDSVSTTRLALDDIATGPNSYIPATHACALQNGNIECWGNDSFAQLGSRPTTVDGPPGLVEF